MILISGSVTSVTVALASAVALAPALTPGPLEWASMIFFWSCDVHFQFAIVIRKTIECLDRVLHCFLVRHFDESEALGLARNPVFDQGDRSHAARLSK